MVGSFNFSLYKTTPQTMPSNTTKIFMLAKTIAGESLSKICALTYRAMFEKFRTPSNNPASVFLKFHADFFWKNK